MLPLGILHSALRSVDEAPKQAFEGAPDAWLELDAAFAPGLEGIAAGDELMIITWLHRGDRSALRVHPRSDPQRSLTGVFATRSESRPNPLGLHPVTVRAVEGTRLRVGPIEAIDGTPVVDIKPVLKPRSYQSTIDAFVEAFNRNDLDAVMHAFADDAVYLPGDGKEHRGRAAIRTALEAQFAGAYGRMHFDEHDRLEDSSARKLAIRWTCRHDIAGPRPARRRLRLLQRAMRPFVGTRFGWEGIDVFHFDVAGKIRGKFTYANYPVPLLRRALAGD